MKFLCFFFLLSVSVSAASYSQNARFTLALENVALTDVFSTIRKSSEFTFIYNMDDVRNIRVKSINVHEATIQEILDEILRNTGFVYQIEDYVIVIQPQETKEEKKSLRLKGWVRDQKKEPLPGVTVRMVGVSLGTATNAQGWFAIDLPVTKGEVEFSFVGYKKQKIAFTEKTDTLRIVLEEDLQQVEEVVVTGIFNKPKESFTGAVTSVTKEDLKVNFSRNLIQTLANIDASLLIVQNNEMGSDPNTLPEIQLRGASTMLDISDLENQKKRPEYNQPLFIMDGFEVDLERVMDLNQNDIESITILKDASATSLYGSRGANGVIIITTTLASAGALTVSYEGRLNLQIPDFSTYDNLMTAAEKFEVEKLYGVWDNLSSNLPNGQKYEDAYKEIEAAIADGLNYNWLKVPTRTGVGQNHALRFMGSQESWNYALSLSYDDTKGSMKESDRKNFNGMMQLGWRNDKWNVRQSLSVGINKSQDSPYGQFSYYVQMNRYWEPYDENGKPVDSFYHPTSNYAIDNPLYDHAVGVWNKTKYTNLRSNTMVDFIITPHLKATATLGLNRKSKTADSFIPPEHTRFQYVTDIEKKGSFARGESEETMWQGRFALNYNDIFREKHMVTLGASAELSETTTDDIQWSAVGYISSNVSHPGMSMSYPSTGGTSGSESTVRRASLIATANYYYDQRYFMDLSINYNGASSFGKNNRFQYFYSLGAGWVVSNETFVKEHLPFLDEMRLRYSFGVTGNMFVSPEKSLEVFDRNSSYTYLGGIAWSLNQFANPELEQQNTYQHNAGLDLKLFNSRITVSLNYYNYLTNNTLTDMNLPISHGFERIIGNVGKIRNEGLDGNINVGLYRDTEKKVNWTLNASFSKRKNTVVKLSEGFKERISMHNRSMSTNTDFIKYQEGRSLDAIYGLRTVGVDPTSGQRVFLKKDGVTTTLDQNADDLVYLGDHQPKLNGTFSTSFYYGGFNFTIGFGVRWGGKAINQTEMSKGENAGLTYNLDRRMTKYSWKQVGDQARYKNKYGDYGKLSTYTCDAFVHKDNVFSCNNINLTYMFSQDWFKRATGLQSLSISAYLSDIFYFSTIERERGTSYPFSINPNFSISCTF
ncbi:SusC/RagA family TonB-linked outer membrane protein [Butyricimonas virosa]|uniref:SusC/RagA family TonB-linked outer membrane protein n=1 Tax=Butyricimonas virosa TaxID=544645 RepID=UPI003D05A340